MKRALISVSDKRGIEELARFLVEHEYEIISTGGTKTTLKDADIPVTPIADFTGQPEILEGRVKTLHPKVAAGILFRRNVAEDLHTMDAQGYVSIDIVVVNLYPFAQTVASGKPEADIIENIDIGGPTLVRAAAKNAEWVTILTDPSQYSQFMREYDNGISIEFRHKCRKAAFKLVKEYDIAIDEYFSGNGSGASGPSPSVSLPETLHIDLRKKSALRYGENPHQFAALYRTADDTTLSLVDAEQLAGKELSYNNYLDLDSVLGMILDFDQPFATISKHTNPCGAAVADRLAHAYSAAYEADPLSAYGSIIGVNRVVDLFTAQLIHTTEFVECILAPDFEPDALALLSKKKQRRLLRLPAIGSVAPGSHWLRAIHGGFLYQSADRHTIGENDLTVVTEVKPTAEQIRSLLFAFRLVKHVKSNAIIVVRDTHLVGHGAGQTSRVDSVDIAVKKAGDRAKGAVLASDAFFPMADGVEAAAAAGVTAIIQPGGSKKDDECIAAANAAGIAMVFTGIRHFKH